MNEKVEVLGMMFEKGTEPIVGALERDKNGVFYGTKYECDYMNLENIKPYLEGGEQYIEDDWGIVTYIFNKKLNMWVSRGLIDTIEVEVVAHSNSGCKADSIITEYIDDNSQYVYIPYVKIDTKIYEEPSTNNNPFVGKRSVEIGSVSEDGNSTSFFRGNVNCRYISEGKPYNGVIGINISGNTQFLILKLDDNDTTELKDKYITVEFCGKLENYISE